MRRGDITQNLHHLNRVLPVDYYKQVLQQLQQVCVRVWIASMTSTASSIMFAADSSSLACCLV